MHPIAQTIAILLFLFQSSSTLLAQERVWKLDESASKILFISIKQATVVEVHQFEKFSGEISDFGLVNIAIDLTSVNTGIPIRDSRIKKYLFETSKFGEANAYASIDMKTISTMESASTKTVESFVTLDLHGYKKQFDMALNVTKIDSQTLLVETLDPLIINAIDFGLLQGLDQLQKMANLRSINKIAVPVLISLHFKAH